MNTKGKYVFIETGDNTRKIYYYNRGLLLRVV